MSKFCSVSDCKSKVLARGYCNKHYQRLTKRGDPLAASRADDRPAIFKRNYVLIPLGIKAKDGYAKVDLADAGIAKYKWSKPKSVRYPVAYVGKQLRLMHTIIIGNAPKGKDTDHINRDKLDNRRCNLRHVSRGTNIRNAGISKKNTSGIKHVYWSNQAQRWQAEMVVNGERKHLGNYKSKLAAAEAVERFKDGQRKTDPSFD